MDTRKPGRTGIKSAPKRFEKKAFDQKRPTGAGRPARPKPPPPRRDNPRMVALNALMDVTRQGAYAQLALSARLRASKLDRRDKDFATELAYGTLEWQITLDYHINRALERQDLDPVARDILRLGAYQILYLDRVPDHAAVDECVKLARLLRRDAFSGLINGVLRGIARAKETGLPLPPAGDDPSRHLSVAASVPLWIVERLVNAYGFDTARAICQYRDPAHSMTVRATKDRMPLPDFEALMTSLGWSYQSAPLPGVYYVSGTGDVGMDRAFQAGLYSVQGVGSILSAMAVSPKPGQTVLDACAAPGGKTAYLAEMMRGTGRVHAWDIHEHRVEMIRSMIKRLRLDSVRPAVRDASVMKESWAQTMDAVLLDAPCSGLGVMLSKPDVKYRQSPEAVQSLAKLQAELLDACCGYVKIGGTLVYATCSILPEENGKQIEAFLQRHPMFAPDTDGLRRALPESYADRIEGGALQLFAHRDGAEGFFIARLKRERL